MLDKKIGILGGGQLGKMLCMAGAGMSLDISIMDKSASFPAGRVCRNFHEGDITNFQDVLDFGKTVDIVTIEFEKVNVDALYELEKEGVKVYPSASVIETIQDKGVQKEFYQSNSIPTSSFILFDTKEELTSAIKNNDVSFPFVQKTRRDGYDGQGVMICKNQRDVDKIFDTPSVIEELVDIDKELAVIVCRTPSGEIAIYDPVEMVFDPEANLLDYQLAPARIDKSTQIQIHEIAYNIANLLDLIGILAIELFLDKTGNILVNEMAPRPHNSGHHTIEACYTSQYENHLRAILDMPLGRPDVISPSILINLLGSDQYSGVVSYEGLEDILKVNGAHLHIYGKTSTKPYRKMGHVTVLHEKERIPLESIDYIKSSFKTSPN